MSLLFFDGFRTPTYGDIITVWRNTLAVGSIYVGSRDQAEWRFSVGQDMASGKCVSVEAAEEEIEAHFKRWLKSVGLTAEEPCMPPYNVTESRSRLIITRAEGCTTARELEVHMSSPWVTRAFDEMPDEERLRVLQITRRKWRTLNAAKTEEPVDRVA